MMSRFWSRMDALAAELGMSGPAAVSQASESPEDIPDRQTEDGQAE
jgi:hypothetical protein